jgi:hypothetical protein
MLILGLSFAIWSLKNKPKTNDISLSEKDQQRIKELLKD